MITTNVPLSRTLALWGSLLCESGPIYVISLYLIVRHNSLIITEGWTLGASTPVFLSRYCEGLATKAKDLSRHEMRLPPPPPGHQPSISWSLENYCFYCCCCFCCCCCCFCCFYCYYYIEKVTKYRYSK